MSDDTDWRLRADLQASDGHGLLEHLVTGARGPDVAKEMGAEVPDDVVITHDRRQLFAYAATQDSLKVARSAIEGALERDGVRATITVSHWDERFDEWLQVDPPLSGQAKQAEESKERDEGKVESRTLVISAGKLIRAEVEQTMRDWAKELALQLELHEHPHLLTTQVAFSVTGPRRKLDEFAQGLRAEELATMRTERAVMLSPL